MRLQDQRFSIPDCITEDNLPDKAFRLLVFLFKISDCAGRCSPGYETMKAGANITSRSTISEALKLLRKRGWFHFTKKGGNRNSVLWLRIPPRYDKTAQHKAMLDSLAIRIIPRSEVQ